MGAHTCGVLHLAATAQLTPEERERLERVLRSPGPRWFSTDGDIDMLPEAAEDRVRIAPSSGAVRGIKFLTTFDRGRPFRLTSDYVLSRGRKGAHAISPARSV